MNEVIDPNLMLDVIANGEPTNVSRLPSPGSIRNLINTVVLVLQLVRHVHQVFFRIAKAEDIKHVRPDQNEQSTSNSESLRRQQEQANKFQFSQHVLSIMKLYTLPSHVSQVKEGSVRLGAAGGKICSANDNSIWHTGECSCGIMHALKHNDIWELSNVRRVQEQRFPSFDLDRRRRNYNTDHEVAQYNDLRAPAVWR